MKVAPDDPIAHMVLRAGRQRKGWRQRELAEAISISQAAISQFETSGSGLSKEKAEAIAEALGVDLDAVPGDLLPPARPSVAAVLWHCPNYDCPSNVPFVVRGQMCYEPRMVRAAAEQRWCAHCGEVMLRCCEGCEAPIEKSAFCTACGRARVSPPPSGAPADEEARERAAAARARIEELRRMTEVREDPPAKGRTRGKPR